MLHGRQGDCHRRLIEEDQRIGRTRRGQNAALLRGESAQDYLRVEV
jgi:hypothetical protein